MTFFKWLSTQVERDDPVGDVARDFMADAKRPKTGSVALLRVRMMELRASSDAFAALERARLEYRQRPKS